MMTFTMNYYTKKWYIVFWWNWNLSLNFNFNPTKPIEKLILSRVLLQVIISIKRFSKFYFTNWWVFTHFLVASPSTFLLKNTSNELFKLRAIQVRQLCLSAHFNLLHHTGVLSRLQIILIFHIFHDNRNPKRAKDIVYWLVQLNLMMKHIFAKLEGWF